MSLLLVNAPPDATFEPGTVNLFEGPVLPGADTYTLQHSGALDAVLGVAWDNGPLNADHDLLTADNPLILPVPAGAQRVTFAINVRNASTSSLMLTANSPS